MVYKDITEAQIAIVNTVYEKRLYFSKKNLPEEYNIIA